jgi:hypothetical protein
MRQLLMQQIKQGGLTPAKLDELVQGDCWRRWCEAEPALATVSSLQDLRELRGEPEDRILGALIRLAAKDGGDDDLAAVAVMHQLGGSFRLMAIQLQNVAGRDVDGLVAGAAWEQIRTFPWRRRTRHYAASVIRDTRRSVVTTLMPDRTRAGVDRTVSVDPQSWLFEAVVEHAESCAGQPVAADSAHELTRFLSWAVEGGFVQEQEVDLLIELMAADRTDETIPRWNRGACSISAAAQVAERRGVCVKTVFRRRDRVIARLRDVVPQYVEAA